MRKITRSSILRNRLMLENGIFVRPEVRSTPAIACSRLSCDDNDKVGGLGGETNKEKSSPPPLLSAEDMESRDSVRSPRTAGWGWVCLSCEAHHS